LFFLFIAGVVGGYWYSQRLLHLRKSALILVQASDVTPLTAAPTPKPANPDGELSSSVSDSLSSSVSADSVPKTATPAKVATSATPEFVVREAPPSDKIASGEEGSFDVGVSTLELNKLSYPLKKMPGMLVAFDLGIYCGAQDCARSLLTKSTLLKTQIGKIFYNTASTDLKPANLESTIGAELKKSSPAAQIEWVEVRNFQIQVMNNATE
jgi:hypothetical protein